MTVKEAIQINNELDCIINDLNIIIEKPLEVDKIVNNILLKQTVKMLGEFQNLLGKLEINIGG